MFLFLFSFAPFVIKFFLFSPPPLSVRVGGKTRLMTVDCAICCRQVLERCITLQLPAKKMKTIFSKFLEFETHHGDAERQDYVRKKALDYVESKTEAADE